MPISACDHRSQLAACWCFRIEAVGASRAYQTDTHVYQYTFDVMLEKLVMKGIIFIFIIVSSCHLNHIKKVNNYFQYNIDFRAGFNNDTLSVIFEKSDTLINEELISTSNDGSYFTWKRIRYEYIKGGIS
jgi:hypothetical protein